MNYSACFYVIDDSGDIVSDYFNTFNQAIKACKKYSKNHSGKYSVSVAHSSVYFENGIDITTSIL